jgi:hypothetical protein
MRFCKKLQLASGFWFATALLACGGGGATVAPSGTFNVLADPPGNPNPGSAAVSAVSNDGVAFGYGNVAVLGFNGRAALVWSGSTCLPVIPNENGLNESIFSTVSQDGNWVGGTERITLPSNTNIHNIALRIIRFNRSTAALSITADPLPGYLNVALPLTIDNSGAMFGFSDYTENFVNAFPFFFNVDSLGALTTTAGSQNDYYAGLNLTYPSGTTVHEVRGVSQNLRFAFGSVTHPAGAGTAIEGIVWDTLNGTYALTGFVGILDTFCEHVSDDGQTATVECSTGSGIWKAGHGITRVIDLLHANNQANTWDNATLSGDHGAVSRDGRYIAGQLSHNGNNVKACFVFKLP